MAKFTLRINRAAPHGSDWQDPGLTFRTERAAVVELVRILDRDYPNQWELNGCNQFLIKDSGAGSWVLADIAERSDERERLEADIRSLSKQLQEASSKLKALNERVDLERFP